MPENASCPSDRKRAFSIEAPGDPLHEALRSSAKRYLDSVIESELAHFLERFQHLRCEDGQQAVVRNGYGPERSLVTGLGPIPLRLPKVRLRTSAGSPFRSALVPAYRRRVAYPPAPHVAASLYIKGILSQNVADVMRSLLGEGAPFIVPTLAMRIASAWKRLCDDVSAKSLKSGAWQAIRATRIPLANAVSGPSCAMVLIGRKLEGTSELLDVRGCPGKTHGNWLRAFQALEQRGAHLPQIIEIAESGCTLARAGAVTAAGERGMSSDATGRYVEIQHKSGIPVSCLECVVTSRRARVDSPGFEQAAVV